MPLPIPCGQTISQPSVVGLMTQALDVQPRDKVLRDRYRLRLSGGDPEPAWRGGSIRSSVTSGLTQAAESDFPARSDLTNITADDG